MEEMRKLAKAVLEAWRKILEQLTEFVRENWQWVKEAAVKWYQLEEEKKVVVRQHHKRNFNRQKISHQVIDRKPQHMVRKIIR